MFIPRISQPSCSGAWLAGSQAVYALSGHEGHHVVIDVEDPVALSQKDMELVNAVDAYLEKHRTNAFLVQTVANTIFPQSTYEDHGSPEFYDVYINKIFPRLKRSSQDWGRYFERMIAYPAPNGPLNLLSDLVVKMRKQVNGDRTFRNIFELPIYNPIKDASRSPRGGQCLSYMSFKLDKNHRLLLSAMYRNHYYTEKLLGNLIGLGRLMAFIAGEVGVSVGPLSILSTHAEVDMAGGSRADLQFLHSLCADILR
jgi:hypothetical protein